MINTVLLPLPSFNGEIRGVRSTGERGDTVGRYKPSDARV